MIDFDAIQAAEPASHGQRINLQNGFTIFVCRDFRPQATNRRWFYLGASCDGEKTFAFPEIWGASQRDIEKEIARINALSIPNDKRASQ